MGTDPDFFTNFSIEKKSGSVPISCPTSLPGGHSECEPPDPISNSEVKPLSADDSVGAPM